MQKEGYSKINLENQGLCLKIKLCILLLICDLSRVRCEKDESSSEPISAGNLALPISQQPGPLFGFGQNIVDKGDKQGFLTIDDIQGKRKCFVDFTPTFLYGISNNLSVFAYLPIASRFRTDGRCSAGFEDMVVQFEYAYHNKNTPRYLNQATVVGALVLPFGSFRKLPPTGFGSPSIFLGLTASHNAIEWYLFGSPGVLITTPHHGTKFGNLFFYQTGFGRNITYVPKELIFMWMIELFGIYRQRDKINYAINPNSGSHIFSIGPSLWLSTQRVILQAGASFPLYQHFNGNQRKNYYWFSLYAGWKFNS